MAINRKLTILSDIVLAEHRYISDRLFFHYLWTFLRSFGTFHLPGTIYLVNDKHKVKNKSFCVLVNEFLKKKYWKKEHLSINFDIVIFYTQSWLDKQTYLHLIHTASLKSIRKGGYIPNYRNIGHSRQGTVEDGVILSYYMQYVNTRK